MPKFVVETRDAEVAEGVGTCSLMSLLSLPYSTVAERFKEAAFDLKETIVMKTWRLSGGCVNDFTLYTGSLGTAFLLFKAYQVTHNRNDLNLCSEIVMACDSASQGSGNMTFVIGRAGVCALGAVAAKLAGDERLLHHYVTQFQEIQLPEDVPNELFYGRGGFLWAYSFLNKHIGKVTIPSTCTGKVVSEVMKDGRRLSEKGRCPLIYEWNGKQHWGAAHGLPGIMHVLMDMELKPDEQEDIKGTLSYMIKNRFPSGNYLSNEGNEADCFMHWCHGASGIALTLVKAAEVFGDKEFLQAAVDAGEVVWNRGLLKRVGLCHAQKLISEGEMHGGDQPYSLFEGIGGMAYLFLDMIVPYEARFPAYEF
ncbi:hypothetical protein HHK36_023679 [Tetracentron sinense]|uniref:Uncharacterized protein n=1 Tax=Tetracentron sinense TaxID=13715 RepID=A0A834YP60_TETSI|nr:hypothetical protein HHK36_023679 [Tetracentron sinense]